MLGVKPDLKLEDEAFNKRWRVQCDDEAFAVAVLSPQLQELSRDSPKTEWWAIGGPNGLVCCGRKASSKVESMEKMLARLEQVLQTMPVEARAGLGM